MQNENEYEFSLDESEFDESEEEDPEMAMLCSLTQIQLNHLLKHCVDEVKASEDKIDELNCEIDKLESQKCAAERSPKENKIIHEKRHLLETEKEYRARVQKRIDCIKCANPRYATVKMDNLPRVVICGKWDTGLPKIVVCKGPPKKLTKKKLDNEFGKVLTPRQIEEIEDEKRWINLTCGELEMQVAGLKGQVRMVSNENNVLRAIIDNENNDADSDANKGSKKPKKKPAKVNIAHVKQPTQTEEPSPDVLAVTFSTRKLTIDEVHGPSGSAQKSVDTLKAQHDALKCLKRSLSPMTSKDQTDCSC